MEEWVCIAWRYGNWGYRIEISLLGAYVLLEGMDAPVSRIVLHIDLSMFDEKSCYIDVYFSTF